MTPSTSQLVLILILGMMTMCHSWLFRFCFSRKKSKKKKKHVCDFCCPCNRARRGQRSIFRMSPRPEKYTGYLLYRWRHAEGPQYVSRWCLDEIKRYRKRLYNNNNYYRASKSKKDFFFSFREIIVTIIRDYRVRERDDYVL